MARSSLLGIDPVATEAAGRDKASLGPGDSSDSGSDIMGLGGEGEGDGTDPGLPVDVALRDDQAAPLCLGESLASSEGETGVRDGTDIGVDRVFTPVEADDVDALLAAVGEAPLSEDDDDEEEEADEPAETRQPGGSDPAGHRPGRS